MSGTRVYGHLGVLYWFLGIAGSSAVAFVFFAVGILLTGWTTVTPESARTGMGLLMVVFSLLCVAFIFGAWRRSFVIVSEEGLKPGWPRSQPVGWDEIVSIDLDPGGAHVLSAQTASGEWKHLLNIPPPPLAWLFGHEGHRRRVNAAIERIEAKRPR